MLSNFNLPHFIIEQWVLVFPIFIAIIVLIRWQFIFIIAIIIVVVVFLSFLITSFILPSVSVVSSTEL